MSVWAIPTTNHPVLEGSDGVLLSVSIPVEPRELEDLLDALAQLSFPINPQIHHVASPTLVEFPAYACRLPEIKKVLRDYGFKETELRAVDMLQTLHSAAGAV